MRTSLQRSRVALSSIVITAVLSACDSAEPPAFSKLPDPCFAGLDDALQKVAGQLPEDSIDQPGLDALPAIGKAQHCSATYRDPTEGARPEGEPYRRNISVRYTLYTDTRISDDVVSLAADDFRRPAFRPSSIQPSTSLGIGDEAVSWPGKEGSNTLAGGWHVDFRASNMRVEVTVDGEDYAADADGSDIFPNTRPWNEIPGQLREPAEEFARAVVRQLERSR